MSLKGFSVQVGLKSYSRAGLAQIDRTIKGNGTTEAVEIIIH